RAECLDPLLGSTIAPVPPGLVTAPVAEAKFLYTIPFGPPTGYLESTLMRPLRIYVERKFAPFCPWKRLLQLEYCRALKATPGPSPRPRPINPIGSTKFTGSFCV